MVGFTLAHSGLLLLFVFPVLGLPLWELIALGRLVFLKVKGRGVKLADVILSLSGVVVLVLLVLPEGAWDRLFLGKLAGSPYATEFLTTAAAEGRTGVVNGLLSRGLRTESRDRYGNTPLLAGTNGRQAAVVLELIERGADVNAVDGDGRSALANAVDEAHPEMVDLLRTHGGREIRPPKVEAPPASVTVTTNP